MCRSESTRSIIFSHWSSLVGLGFYNSSCLPIMSTLCPNVCQVSWEQWVGTNTLCGGLRTRSLKWIAQGRIEFLDLHRINTRFHEKYPNWEIYSTYSTWPRINCLLHRGIGRCSRLYRVIHEEYALLWKMIVWVILSKKVIRTWGRFWTVTELWPLETWNRR